ncbi:hypothetical protein GCM10011375_14970 [Hymenobacter qilianensis]|uniref:Uncharacterized protein n=1 Tax=Hymenobacter qilianensis TaxID=1385715 RepID=A0ACB5PQ09_9BACT|nr:hypothetical protein GCM10011375_14970 [Hymenobacter qilianensis]
MQAVAAHLYTLHGDIVSILGGYVEAGGALSVYISYINLKLEQLTARYFQGAAPFAPQGWEGRGAEQGGTTNKCQLEEKQKRSGKTHIWRDRNSYGGCKTPARDENSITFRKFCYFTHLFFIAARGALCVSKARPAGGHF